MSLKIFHVGQNSNKVESVNYGEKQKKTKFEFEKKITHLEIAFHIIYE